LPTKRSVQRWQLIALFLISLGLRWAFTPNHNVAEDPFEVIEGARHLEATGQYLVPRLGGPDLQVHYVLPSWPVGFPLLLALAFRVFGPQEVIARVVTMIVSSMVAPLTAGLAYSLGGGMPVALLAGFLAAIHPLAMAFGGQIFTNNLSLTLLLAAMLLLVKSLRSEESEIWANPSQILSEPKRLRTFVAAFFFLGLLLTVRDTDVLFLPAFIGILYCAWFMRQGPKLGAFGWTAFRRVGLYSVIFFLAGFSPSLYFNTVNFGQPFVSAHAETGFRLSLDYLLLGSRSPLPLPGVVVMAMAVMLYQFPLFAGWIMRPHRRSGIALLGLIIILLVVPLLLVNGAYPVASSGAAGRYVLVLVPFSSILAAWAFVHLWHARRRWALAGLGTSLILWQLLLTYPPPSLFKLWPRFAYLAFYSPIYNVRPYHNYPDHTNAMVKWVKENTPRDAVIISPSRVQHYYYYAKRDAMWLSMLAQNRLLTLAANRPVYLVEDNQAVENPAAINTAKRMIVNAGLTYEAVGYVDVFNPVRGEGGMHVYRILRSSASRASNLTEAEHR
jgi:hypothetical protein